MRKGLRFFEEFTRLCHGLEPWHNLFLNFYIMRKPTDLCLLCCNQPALKTNSHIIPKFLSVGFLGPKQARRGYDLSTERDNHRVIQDSPKENYIFCEDCEKYFEVLETSCAEVFKKWPEKLEDGQYEGIELAEGMKVVKFTNALHEIFRLLIYSLFWRTHISSDDLFNHFDLGGGFSENLRLELMYYNSQVKENLKAKILEKKVEDFPFAIFTASEFIDETNNFLYASDNKKPFAMVIDKFAFVLYQDRGDIVPREFSVICNLSSDNTQMVVFTKEQWHKIVLQGMLKLFIEVKKVKH